MNAAHTLAQPVSGGPLSGDELERIDA
ncbi:MAG: hypothetical protein QOJ12_2963, partial [Thermoleophilales bacterium]|nr:hypothetical protein [Thermoleophilales bacterium]